MYSTDQIHSNALSFRILKLAILSLTFKVVTHENVLSCTPYGLTFADLLALFEDVDSVEIVNLNEADLYKEKMEMEERVKNIL